MSLFDFKWLWGPRLEDLPDSPPIVPDGTATFEEGCVLYKAETINVPSTYYMKEGGPIIVIESNHYHLMQDGLTTLTMMGRRWPGVSNIESLQEGIYTLEHYIDLEEFVVTRYETEPGTDTEGLSS